MKVLFVFNSQFCGESRQIIDIPDNTEEKSIKAMFSNVMGVPYSKDCYYEILGGYVPDTESPCNDCASSNYCDGWGAQFCCTLCQYEGGEHCSDCDKNDI